WRSHVVDFSATSSTGWSCCFLWLTAKGRYPAPSRPPPWMIWKVSRGPGPTSARHNSCDSAIGLKSVPLANSWRWSSRALLQALSCAVSISKHSCGRSQQACCTARYPQIHRERLCLGLALRRLGVLELTKAGIRWLATDNDRTRFTFL